MHESIEQRCDDDDIAEPRCGGRLRVIASIEEPELIERILGALKYVLVTPQSHRLHHALGETARDKNFGAVLSLWDVLFGTYVAPTDEDYELGVADDVPLARGLIGV